MPQTEKKLLTTEKVTTSDEAHTRTEKITISDEVVKVTNEVHKSTDKIKSNQEVYKGTEKLEDTKEAVITICRKDSYKFEGQSKGSIGRLILIVNVLKKCFYTWTRLLLKLYEKYIEGLDI